MRRICASCKRELPSSDPGANEDTPVSHGLCDACMETMLLAELGQPLTEFLGTFDTPIALVGPGTTIRAANERACALLGTDPRTLSGQKWGDIIACRHASNPNGCGRGIHCKSCTIRRTVEMTKMTGRPMVRVRAYPDTQVGVPPGELRPYIEISTEKVGDLVLLRIDERGQDTP